MKKSTKEKLAQYDEETQRLVEQWLSGKASDTKTTYLTYLILYCERVGKTPSQLLEERTNDYKPKDGETASESLLRRKNAEREFQTTFNNLESELSSGTITTARMIVKSFYSYIGLPMTKADTTYRKSKERKFRDVELSESDYKALVDAGDYKEKIRTVWLAQTGMRVGDAQKFKVSDLTEYDLKNLKAKKTPMAIEYLPEKTMGREIGERYTFLGAFGIKLLSTDLKYRIEKEGVEAVRNQYVFQGQSEGNTPLSTVQWTAMFKSLAKKAQLELNGKHGRIRSHCFRKFFDSTLQGKNVNRNVVYWMMGHRLEGTEETYFQGQSRKEELREIYAGIEHYLTPEEKQIVERTVIPSEVTEQMANMFKTITTLKVDLEEQKKNYEELKRTDEELKADLDRLASKYTEEGLKNIFEGARKMTPEESKKLRLPKSIKRSE